MLAGLRDARDYDRLRSMAADLDKYDGNSEATAAAEATISKHAWESNRRSLVSGTPLPVAGHVPPSLPTGPGTGGLFDAPPPIADLKPHHDASGGGVVAAVKLNVGEIVHSVVGGVASGDLSALDEATTEEEQLEALRDIMAALDGEYAVLKKQASGLLG